LAARKKLGFLNKHNYDNHGEWMMRKISDKLTIYNLDDNKKGGAGGRSTAKKE